MQSTNLQDTLYQIYLNNLNFLEKEFPQVFEKIVILHQSIDNKQHEPKFELEFQEKEGCFNILDLSKNEMIYKENSYQYSDEIANNADLSKKDTLSLLALDFSKNKLLKDTFVKELNPIKDSINTNIDFDKYSYIKIYKYLFMGTGLGIYINGIVNKFKPNSIFIVEPSIEIFRLSLFVTDYSQIHKHTKIFFSIAQARNERNVMAQVFFKYQPYLNYAIKYNLFSNEYTNVLNDIYKKFTQQHSEAFSYKPQLIGVKRSLERVNEEYKFLDIKQIQKKSLIEDKKVLIIGAGPSAKQNIEAIKKYQDKFYLVVVSTMIPYMIENDIKPDMVVVIDYEDPTEKFFEHPEIKTFLKNTPIIMPTQVSMKVIEKLDKENILMLQTYTMFDELGPSFIVGNVGAYSMLLMGILKVKQAYLVGIDCAFDQNTGEMHSSNVVVTRHFDASTMNEKITAKGNFRDFVYTTDELLNYKNDFESVGFALNVKQNYNYYNLSDGAMIEGLEPLRMDDIQVDTFESLNKQEINKKLFECSLVIAKKNYNDDIEKLDSIKKLLLKYKKNNLKNRDQFINEQIQLLVSIIEITRQMSSPIFAEIFMEFLEVSGIYLYFFVNVKGSHINNSKQINNINIKWTVMALNVISEMRDSFK